MRDIAAMMHQGCYGKSDKVNATENQSEDFKAGYAAGSTDADPADLIPAEWDRRGEPDSGPELASFNEWKRGMWAASMQATVAKTLTGN
jgi:hypothetical protein